jgi:NAD(P)-dependent dehydrogenase (short-subunit alcohol dehydrogenase family)
MDLGMNGSRVVVTGAARGIGRAIAAAFLDEGATVAYVDRDPAVEVAVSEDTATRTGRGMALTVDVADPADVGRLAGDLQNLMGGCDHLVHAAAIGSGRFGMPFWNVPIDAWDRVFRVNVMGAVHLAHAFAPAMAERGSGTLLFLGSVAGQIGSPTDPPYSASKAALINFAQCAARDLARSGVRVNTLNPGMVRTALNRSVWEAWIAAHPEDAGQSYEAWTAEKIARLVPLNRWQEPEDVAAMAVFLASRRAGNVTGQTINVDGGYVMHW